MCVEPAPGCRETFDWGYRRFLDEARIQAKFRHPNIPALHRYFRTNGTAYVAMEYVRGHSLADRLASREPLPLTEWRAWLDRLLDALQHVHAHDYLHRDVTPHNVLIREADDQPVLIDFGAARIATGERTRTVVLNEAYAPPEQRSERAKQGPYTDIYSVAAVSYRVLAGNRPASAADRAAGEEHQPLVQRLGEAAEWMATVDRALALRPVDRPQTVVEWRKELSAAAAKMWLRGEPVGSRDTEGLTALHRAAAGEPLPEVVALLLDEGADIRIGNEVGETPLHSAAGENPNAEVVTLLLDRGASLDALDCRGNTPLHSAAGHNRNPTVLKVLIDRGCNLHKTNRAGATALHLAASEGAFGAVRELVLRGASLWSLDGGGCNALHHAAQRDRLRTSKMLLDNGAAITGRPPVDTSVESGLDLGKLTGDALLFRWWLAFDSYEPTDAVPIARHDPDWALWYLCVDSHRDVTDWAEATPLHSAAKTNSQRVARLLLDRGANPGAKDPVGMTPLHLSALYAAVETAATLLDAGSDLNIQDGAGRTPLHFAAWGNSRSVAELLLQRGAALQTSQHTRSEYCVWKDVIGARDIVATLLRRGPGSIREGSQANDQLSETSWAGLRPVAEVLLNRANTPLHWAAFGDSRDVAEVLLDEGADVHGGRSEGTTPLDLAALGNSTNTARLLMERGAVAQGRKGNPATPLHWAALGNACETLALLIDRGADPAVRPDRWTPLHFAALGNAREAMELLLARGAEMGPQNTSGTVLRSWYDWREAREGVPAYDAESSGGTLLHWASVRNAADVVDLLMERGADLEAEDGEGRTPLDYAAQGNAVAAAERLLDGGADSRGSQRTHHTPLHIASSADATDAVRLLLERGSEVNAGRSEVGTPLHMASSAEMAGLLLDNGAHVDDLDAHGRSPLHSAVNEDVAQLLLKRGADLEMTDRDGNAPLHSAASVVDNSFRAKDVVLYLLEHGAAVSVANDAGKTPLIVAMESRAPKVVVTAFLDCGADINATDSHGSSLLHLTTRYESSLGREVAALLLERGADANLQDDRGRTPLHVAAEIADSRGDEDLLWLAQLLIDGNANIHIRDKAGCTALEALQRCVAAMDTQGVHSQAVESFRIHSRSPVRHLFSDAGYQRRSG